MIRQSKRSKKIKVNETKMEDDSLFGCHISLKNLSFGGLSGYSFGNVRLALKKPPSYMVFDGPMIMMSQL